MPQLPLLSDSAVSPEGHQQKNVNLAREQRASGGLAFGSMQMNIVTNPLEWRISKRGKVTAACTISLANTCHWIFPVCLAIMGIGIGTCHVSIMHKARSFSTMDCVAGSSLPKWHMTETIFAF